MATPIAILNIWKRKRKIFAFYSKCLNHWHLTSNFWCYVLICRNPDEWYLNKDHETRRQIRFLHIITQSAHVPIKHFRQSIAEKQELRSINRICISISDRSVSIFFQVLVSQHFWNSSMELPSKFLEGIWNLRFWSRHIQAILWEDSRSVWWDTYVDFWKVPTSQLTVKCWTLKKDSSWQPIAWETIKSTSWGCLKS